MCEYCEKLEDEDDFIPIGNTLKINCGVFGEIKSEIEFAMSTDNSSYRLVHYLYPQEIGDIEYESISINYCPFCGRKLSKGSE